jgi:hypothetical protein
LALLAAALPVVALLAAVELRAVVAVGSVAAEPDGFSIHQTEKSRTRPRREPSSKISS